jgi:spermidine synthase
MKRTLGTQWIVELYGCDPTALERVPWVQETLLTAASRANVKIVSFGFHQFEPYGVSGVIIVEESHIAIHTWPEYRYAALDLFFCSPSVNTRIIIQTLKERFCAESFKLLEIKRGLESPEVSTDFTLEEGLQVAHVRR